MKKTTSRALSVILAVLMLVSAMPMAFAAEPIALKATNVTEWPTAKGEIFYGQTVGEGITLEGGKVVYNGIEVPGKFIHWNENFRPTSVGDNSKANLTFVPDDTTAYKGFNKLMSTDTTYKVKKTTAVFADESDMPIASSIKSGETLSASTITGGAMINPYYAEESTMKGATWQWVNPNTVVTESGEYDAYFSVVEDRYESVTQKIYVEVEVDVFLTEVKTLPTVETLTYNPEVKWNSIALSGGSVVVKGTDTLVEGSFSVTDLWKNVVPKVGSYEIDVLFTPIDTEKYTTVEMKVPVTVNAATVKFVDESGEETIPEITIDRVLEVGDDLSGYLKPYLNASCSFNYEETEGYGQKIKPGTHEYTVKTIIDDPNYERYGTLTFKIVLNKEKVNAKVKNVVGGKQIYIEGGDTYHLNGNFDVKYFIDGKEAGIIKDIKLNEKFEIKQNKSGVYTYEIVYNGTEDDYYDITVITEAEDIKLQHQVKVVGQEAVTYKYSDTVTINAPAHEKPYYEFTGWVNESGITLSDEQRSAESISTTMPDNDIELEATYKFNFSLFIKYIFNVICSWFAKIAAFITGAFAV